MKSLTSGSLRHVQKNGGTATDQWPDERNNKIRDATSAEASRTSKIVTGHGVTPLASLDNDAQWLRQSMDRRSLRKLTLELSTLAIDFASVNRRRRFG